MSAMADPLIEEALFINLLYSSEKCYIPNDKYVLVEWPQSVLVDHFYTSDNNNASYFLK